MADTPNFPDCNPVLFVDRQAGRSNMSVSIRSGSSRGIEPSPLESVFSQHTVDQHVDFFGGDIHTDGGQGE